MARLEGKVIVVTGGGRGFGRAYCLGLSREGAIVVIAEQNEDTALQTQAAVEELGGRSIVCITDVSDEGSVLAMRDSVDKQLGGIDGLINNAGIFPRLQVDTVTKEGWDRIFDTNVWGTFICARAVASSMGRRGGGSIINLSSGLALRPLHDQLPYVATKGAVIALTRSLATDLAPQNIRVNSILPGLTATEGVLEISDFSEEVLDSRVVVRQLIKRRQRPDDVVGAAIFLLSDESSFVTGQSLPVNGGGVMV